jgi:hypothetical protein
MPPNNFTGLTIGSGYGSQNGGGGIEMLGAQASLADRKLQQSLAMTAQNGIRLPNRIQTAENFQRSSEPPASLSLRLAVEHPMVIACVAGAEAHCRRQMH